jgi:macrolide-specific efflux system membrane fusion protein
MASIDASTNKVRRMFSWFFKASLFMKALIIIMLGIFLWFLGTKVFLKSDSQQQVQTAQAEKGTLITSINASGTVSSANNTSISTAATGVVTALYVQNGDSVTQGDKIADISLDQASQQKQAAAWASYLGAQNSLNAAKAKMNSLQSALFKANRAFVEDKGVSEPDKSDPTYIQENADWQQAESDYKNQSGVITQAEAALTSAWLSYAQSSATITAPASGTITNLILSEGMAISSSNNSSASNNDSSASNSQTLGSITAEQNQLQAKVNLSEIDVTTVDVGQKATMTLDAFPDKTFTGRVVAIDTNGTTSSGVTTYPVTITFDTAESHIYPNMTVNATIITKVLDNVLLIPSAAVQTQNGQQFVRVRKNGKIEQVAVTVGESSDAQTEITSGLSEGDEVVTSTISTTTGTTTTGASPFGGTGFGGNRGFGGGGQRVIINR